MKFSIYFEAYQTQSIMPGTVNRKERGRTEKFEQEKERKDAFLHKVYLSTATVFLNSILSINLSYSTSSPCTFNLEG